MPGRSFVSGTGYRYGFNGKESDDEVKGAGNSQDYGMRIYDPRIGRFLSVDPLTKAFPWFSPYHYAGNTPIQAVDLDGLEILDFRALYRASSQYNEMEGKVYYDIALINGEHNDHVHSSAASHAPKSQFPSPPDPNQGTMSGVKISPPKQISTGEMGKQQKYDQSGKQNGANAIAVGKAVDFGTRTLRKLAETNIETSAQDDLMSQKAFGIAYEAVSKYDNLLKGALISHNFDDKSEAVFTQFKADVMNFVVDKRGDNATDEYGIMVKNMGNYILNKENLNTKIQSKQTFWNKLWETYKKVAGDNE